MFSGVVTSRASMPAAAIRCRSAARRAANSSREKWSSAGALTMRPERSRSGRRGHDHMWREPENAPGAAAAPSVAPGVVPSLPWPTIPDAAAGGQGSDSSARHGGRVAHRYVESSGTAIGAPLRTGREEKSGAFPVGSAPSPSRISAGREPFLRPLRRRRELRLAPRARLPSGTVGVTVRSRPRRRRGRHRPADPVAS